MTYTIQSPISIRQSNVAIENPPLSFDEFSSYKPPLGSGIFDPATFDDTGEQAPNSTHHPSKAFRYYKL